VPVQEAVGGEGRDEGADVRTERFKPTKVRYGVALMMP
jgi:hypothetical protein